MRMLGSTILLAALMTFPGQLSAQVDRVAEVRLTLGGLEAPEHLSFVRAPSILASGRDELFVLDRSAATVWVLDAGGALIRRVGGEGQGPGEFTSPQRLGLLSDTLWVTDFPSPRVSFFDANGSHLQTQRLESADLGVATSAPNSPTGFHRGGFLTVVPNSFPVGRSGRVELPVLHGPRDGGLSSVGHVIQPPGLTIAGVGHFGYNPVLIPPLVTEDRYGRGWVEATWLDESPDEVTVRRIGEDGVERWTTRVAIPSVLVGRERLIDGGVEVAADIVEAAIRRGDVSGEIRDLVEAGLYLPEATTSLENVFVDADDRTWLGIRHPEDGLSWLVLDSSGAVRFRVVGVPEVEIRTAQGSVAWGVTTGDFDETYLVRLEF
jgi:hypothetical protein